MAHSKNKQKKEFYKFFNLSDDSQLVTHINKDTCKLEDSYTVKFSANGVKFKAWVHLHDEENIYKFFSTHKDQIAISEKDIRPTLSYKDRWKRSMSLFLEDLFVAEWGYTVLISLDQEPEKNIVVYPMQYFFATYALFHSQEMPPSWMSAYDIGNAQAFYKSVNSILD